MSEHTSEPWESKEVALDYRLYGAGGELIGYEAAQTSADARRIVACVNACEGIDTDWLEEVTEADDCELGATIRPTGEPLTRPLAAWRAVDEAGIPTEALQDGIIEEVVGLLEKANEQGLYRPDFSKSIVNIPEIEAQIRSVLRRLDGGDDS